MFKLIGNNATGFKVGIAGNGRDDLSDNMSYIYMSYSTKPFKGGICCVGEVWDVRTGSMLSLCPD